MDQKIKLYFISLGLKLNGYWNLFYQWIRMKFFLESSIKVSLKNHESPVNMYYRYQIIKMLNYYISCIEYLRNILDIQLQKVKVEYLDNAVEKKMIIDNNNTNDKLTLNYLNKELCKTVNTEKKYLNKHIVLKLEITSNKNENNKMCLKKALSEYSKDHDNTISNVLYFEGIKYNDTDILLIQLHCNRKRILKRFKLGEVQNKKLHHVLEMENLPI